MTSPLLVRFLASFILQSAICDLQSAVYSQQSAVSSQQSAVCSLRSPVCSLRSAVCSLQSAVCGLQSAVCKCHTPASSCKQADPFVFVLSPLRALTFIFRCKVCSTAGEHKKKLKKMPRLHFERAKKC